MQPSARLWAAVEASLHAFRVLKRCIVPGCPTRQAGLCAKGFASLLRELALTTFSDLQYLRWPAQAQRKPRAAPVHPASPSTMGQRGPKGPEPRPLSTSNVAKGLGSRVYVLIAAAQCAPRSWGTDRFRPRPDASTTRPALIP